MPGIGQRDIWEKRNSREVAAPELSGVVDNGETNKLTSRDIEPDCHPIIVFGKCRSWFSKRSIEDIANFIIGESQCFFRGECHTTFSELERAEVI